MEVLESKGKTVDEAVFSGLIKMDLSIDEVEIEILDEGGSLFKSAKVRLSKKQETDYDAEAREPEKPQVKKGFEEMPERDDRRPRSFEGRQGRDDNRRRDDHRRDDYRQGDRRQGEHTEFRGETEPEDLPAVPREPGNDAEKFLYGLFTHMRMNVALSSRVEEGMLKVDMEGRGMGMLIGRRGETLDALQYLTSLVINNGKSEYTKVMLDTENYRGKREDTLKRLAAHLADKVQKSGRRVVLEPMNPYERRILHATLQDYAKVYTYSEGEDPYRSVVVALKGQEDDRPPEPVSRPRRHR
jgi:Predicted RNA-binding protein